MIQFNDYKFEYETIGEFHSIGNWIHPKRTISSYELIYMLEGTAYIREGTTDYALNRNDVLILSPGVEHYGFRESSEPTAFIWFHFRTNCPISQKYYSGCDCLLLMQFLKQLLHITNSFQYSATAADALGFIIFEEVTQLYQNKTVHKSPLITQIIDYCRKNLTADLSVSSIARHFGYSADHIGKLFKSSMNIGLKEYIANQRVQQIKDLLFTTNKSLDEISQMLGFSSENALIKFFSYHENTTPSNFRATARNTHINHK